MLSEDSTAIEARNFDDVLELMHGRWDCLEAAINGEDAVHALELALREPPPRTHTD
jgi:hypothetical protein